MPPSVRAIVLHLVGVRPPFVDGNGRTPVAVTGPCRQGLAVGICVISSILKKLAVSMPGRACTPKATTNDVTYFLLYQMRVLLRAIQDLHQYLARKATEMREAEERFDSVP